MSASPTFLCQIEPDGQGCMVPDHSQGNYGGGGLDPNFRPICPLLLFFMPNRTRNDKKMVPGVYGSRGVWFQTGSHENYGGGR